MMTQCSFPLEDEATRCHLGKQRAVLSANSVGTLILNFSASGTMKNNFYCVYIILSEVFCYSVTNKLTQLRRWVVCISWEILEMSSLRKKPLDELAILKYWIYISTSLQPHQHLLLILSNCVNLLKVKCWVIIYIQLYAY